MSSYVLENANEFKRLEKQSQNDSYNYEQELKDFQPKPNGQILDAGCGSGIVSRFLANRFPRSEVLGCDFSHDRITQASQKAKEDQIQNLQFQQEDLTNLSFGASHFDGVVCRYVLEHLSEDTTLQALRELHRVLKPSGEISVIDIDGLVYNVHPQTPLMQRVLNNLSAQTTLDLNIGRKLPHYLGQAGFSQIQWRIETLAFSGEKLAHEAGLLKERFQQVAPFFSKLAGSDAMAAQFTEEYLNALKAPDAVLFYNKFIVTAHKQGFKKLES